MDQSLREYWELISSNTLISMSMRGLPYDRLNEADIVELKKLFENCLVVKID